MIIMLKIYKFHTYGGRIVKKFTLILCALIISSFSFLSTFADEVVISGEEISASSEAKASDTAKTDELEDRMGNASKTTLRNATSKDEKIEQYTKDLGGNRTNGVVYYYLLMASDYSVPVCFVGIVIASLNFFIIGNKKLDKRESGFRMLITLIVGMIVFRVLPLLFTIVVAGR